MSESQASNRFSVLTSQEPDVKDGIDYWNTQPANLDGVLGGYGTGSLPRIDALGSRQLLLFLFPKFCTVDSVINPKKDNPSQQAKRIRALDVGAGIGRVTRDVLLHLAHDVVLVEPVPKYISEAWARGKYHQDPTLEEHDADFRVKWKGIRERTTSVTFIKATHQSLDPSHPLTSTTLLGRVGYTPQNDPMEDIEFGFDIVWCQWSLGHLSNADLVLFLRRAKACLRDTESVIIAKENICVENEDNEGGIFFDDQDSSLTRSDRVFKEIFVEAGLALVHERIQQGFPAELVQVCFTTCVIKR